MMLGAVVLLLRGAGALPAEAEEQPVGPMDLLPSRLSLFLSSSAPGLATLATLATVILLHWWVNKHQPVFDMAAGRKNEEHTA
jgi:hypothetical protein